MDLSSVSSEQLMAEVVARNIKISYKELIEADHVPGWEVIEVGNRREDGDFDPFAIAMVKVPSFSEGHAGLKRFYGTMKKLRKALGVDLV